MFMNLHTLPAGQHMYTVAIANKALIADGSYEEVDVVASSRATADQVIAAAMEDDGYNWPEMTIVGVIDQSDGYTLLDRSAEVFM